MAYVVTHFDNNLTLRTELEMFSGRDRIPTQQLDGAVLANIGVTKKFAGGQELNFAVRNLFDTYYINPTASATRGADVPGLGRTIAASFKVTF